LAVDQLLVFDVGLPLMSD